MQQERSLNQILRNLCTDRQLSQSLICLGLLRIIIETLAEGNLREWVTHVRTVCSDRFLADRVVVRVGRCSSIVIKLRWSFA